MDGIGGADNFSTKGFPWADSDIYGNRISHVYDDAIEAEGANRNVRIWGNYLDRVFVPIANAATSIGPLYVWRKHRIRAESRHRGFGRTALKLRQPKQPVRGRAARACRTDPNFNDRYARPEAGAYQSGGPPLRFGVEALRQTAHGMAVE